MKISTKVTIDTGGFNDEEELVLTDDGWENDYWGIKIGDREYTIHGKEFERLCKAFISNR